MRVTGAAGGVAGGGGGAKTRSGGLHPSCCRALNSPRPSASLPNPTACSTAMNEHQRRHLGDGASRPPAATSAEHQAPPQHQPPPQQHQAPSRHLSSTRRHLSTGRHLSSTKRHLSTTHLMYGSLSSIMFLPSNSTSVTVRCGASPSGHASSSGRPPWPASLIRWPPLMSTHCTHAWQGAAAGEGGGMGGRACRA